MPKFFLRPRNDVLDIKGRLCYHNTWRAWNTIRLKKEFVNEFPQLKEKTKKLCYRMTFYRTLEELENKVKEIRENKEALPILLYLYQQ